MRRKDRTNNGPSSAIKELSSCEIKNLINAQIEILTEKIQELEKESKTLKGKFLGKFFHRKRLQELNMIINMLAEDRQKFRNVISKIDEQENNGQQN